ncbi:hypothetical protein NDU88_003244 [Pleurodeles waltl]|uniref:Uncharacterized protein n=1 Tax=Pleurodeles waltl TaxID=8319 RepID=A0AAV7T4Z7_PLEWA|nr:hypothetical protein NDU88_003244 [Pleurodeles waltl]
MGRHSTRSPTARLTASLPLRAHRPWLLEDVTPPSCQALSAWGEPQVSCSPSRSCRVPGHKSTSPLLRMWRALDTMGCPAVFAHPLPPQDRHASEHSF